MRYCCVCKEPWSPDKDVSFFGFPKNEAILKEWLRLISTVKQSKPHLKVCQAHFRKSDYRQISGKRILKKDAIPSIFPRSVSIDVINSPNKSTEDNSVTTLLLKNTSILSSENKTIPSTSSQCDILVDLTNNPDKLRVDSLLLRNESVLSPEDIDVEEELIIPLEKKRKVDKQIQVSLDMKGVATQISPRRLQPSLREQKFKHEIEILKKRLRRRDIKLLKITNMLKHLKNTGNSSDDLKETLLKHFSNLKLDILQNELRNHHKKFRKSYSNEIKIFASTLYFYSSKAYNLVCQYLSLPYEVTLRKYAEFSCKAGFVDAVFQFLKKESVSCNHLKNVALIMDSMSIKSSVIYDNNNGIFKGYIDYESVGEHLNLKYNKTDLASEVLVFQIVSYTAKFKIPIAHFFVNKITNDIQNKLLLEAMKKLYYAEVTVRSITCDGAKVNFSTMVNLGCFFTSEMKTYFKHRCNNCNVYVT